MTVSSILELSFKFAVLWCCLYAFALTLFRFEFKQYRVQVATSVLLITQLSVLLQLQTISPLLVPSVQFAALAASFVCIFRFHWLYSIIMAVIPYVLIAAVETLTNLILLNFSIVATIAHLKKTGGDTELIIMLLLINLSTLILYKTRIGFSFISRRYHKPVHSDISSLVWAAVGLFLAMVVGFQVKWLFIVGFAGSLIITIMLLAVSYRRELAED